MRAPQRNPPAAPATGDAWQHAPLGDLCRHLVEVHHERTRALLSRARLVLREVLAANPGRTDVGELDQLLDLLEQDLTRHMLVEEMVLFPYVERLVAATEGDASAAVVPRSNALHTVQHDHENASTLLAGILELAARMPAAAGSELERVFAALAALAQDLEVHSRLEDEVLFPRMHRLEEQVARRR